MIQGEFIRDRANKAPLRRRAPFVAKRRNEEVRSVVDKNLSLEVPRCGPVLVNVGQSGYYRTLYTPAEFAAIADKLDTLLPGHRRQLE